MSLPPTFGERKREVVADDIVLPRLFLAFRSPVFGSPGYYVASILSAILGMRRGSRLYRSLVRSRQIAQDVSAFTFDLAKGADLLIVDATARPGVAAEQLENEVEREIDLVLEKGVTEDEVNRARALIEASFTESMQSAGERADQLSRFATYFRNPGLVNEQLERYQAVRASDVNVFARERLGVYNRASLLYLPRAETEETAIAIGMEAMA
jgi:predicted Zn-dependent peptidase